MRFKYIGFGVREIGEYRWDGTNDFTQDIQEPELIENLLTYPDGSFVALDDDLPAEDGENDEE